MARVLLGLLNAVLNCELPVWLPCSSESEPVVYIQKRTMFNMLQLFMLNEPHDLS